MKKKNIKIMVAYHVPFKLLKTDVYTPIHTGREVAFEESNIKKLSPKEVLWMKKNMIGDDTGDNFSRYNRYISEMSAVYWAWKNQKDLGNPDYIGLNHYRRHFILNGKNTSKERWFKNADIFIYHSFNHKYKSLIKEKNLYKMTNDYDIIASKVFCVKNINPNIKNTRDFLTKPEMCNEFAGQYYDKMENLIRTNFPQYVPEFEEMHNKCEYYHCNMFVMRKDLFDEYCYFTFSVLKELLDGYNPPENLPTMGKRTLGYIAEYLTSIFILNYRHKNPGRVKELDLCFVQTKPKKECLKKLLRYLIIRMQY